MLNRPLQLALTLLVLTGSSAARAQSAPADPKQFRARLNQIFYWQIADELKLSTQVEKTMVATIEDIGARREKALSAREDALSALKTTANAAPNVAKAEIEKQLGIFQKASEALAQLEVEEHKKLKQTLGPENLAKFYLVRESVTNKIKEAINRANK